MRATKRFRLAFSSIAVAGLLLGASSAFAEAWPSRSIKLIVPFPPGGAADIVGRVYADKLGEALKQAVRRSQV